MMNSSRSEPSVSVAAVEKLRDACDDLLAHAQDDEWVPRAYPAINLSAEIALQRDADAFAHAVKRVIDEASNR